MLRLATEIQQDETRTAEARTVSWDCGWSFACREAIGPSSDLGQFMT